MIWFWYYQMIVVIAFVCQLVIFWYYHDILRFWYYHNWYYFDIIKWLSTYLSYSSLRWYFDIIMIFWDFDIIMIDITSILSNDCQHIFRMPAYGDILILSWYFEILILSWYDFDIIKWLLICLSFASLANERHIA